MLVVNSRFWQASVQSGMRRLYIGCGPEILVANCANQSLLRNRLDLRHLEHPEINLPLVESIERIMIRAEVFWQTMPANRSMKHPAQCHSINDATVDAKPDYPTRKLVHHNENPRRSQCGRFASE